MPPRRSARQQPSSAQLEIDITSRSAASEMDVPAPAVTLPAQPKVIIESIRAYLHANDVTIDNKQQSFNYADLARRCVEDVLTLHQFDYVADDIAKETSLKFGPRPLLRTPRGKRLVRIESLYEILRRAGKLERLVQRRGEAPAVSQVRADVSIMTPAEISGGVTLVESDGRLSETMLPHLECKLAVVVVCHEIFTRVNASILFSFARVPRTVPCKRTAVGTRGSERNFATSYAYLRPLGASTG